MTGAHQMHRAGWSEDRTKTLTKLWLEGASASQIAKDLAGGLTRAGVIGKVHRLGIADRGKPSVPATSTGDLRAPSVKRDLYAATNGINARGGRPPKPGPQNKPGAVFGAVEVCNAEETEKRRQAAQVQGEKIKAAFAEPANDNAIRLIERGRFQCSWPVGEPDRPANQMCCGARVVDGANKSIETYCADHARKAVARVLVGGKPDAKTYERSLRRYTA